MKSRLLLPLLLIIVMVSGITLVTKRYQSRTLFIQHEQLQLEAQDLDISWRHLQSDRSALARNARIDQLARHELGLTPVDVSRTVYVQGQPSMLPSLDESQP